MNYADLESIFQPLCTFPETRCSSFGEAGYAMAPYFPMFWPKIRDFSVRDTDIFVVTPPKSGTTWMQHMTYLIATGDFEGGRTTKLDQRSPFLEFCMHVPAGPEMIDAVEQQTNCPRIIKSHLPRPFLPTEINRAKMIYVYRDPRDVAVSYFFHYRALRIGPYGNFKGSFKEFARLFIDGKWFYLPYGKHVADYLEASKSGDLVNILPLCYEELKHDTRRMIRKIGQFLGKNLTDETVDQIYEATTVEAMKQNDVANYSWMESLGLWDVNETRFIRKGETGDWRNHFTDEKLLDDFMVQMKKELPTELYDYYVSK